MKHISKKLIKFCVFIYTKTGGTTETALAFRVLKQYLEDRFGNDEAGQRIFTITDPSDGILLKISKENRLCS